MRDDGSEEATEFRGNGRTYERLVALFAAGVVLFHPLVIGIFDAGPHATVAGVPLLYLYLFAGWAALIAGLVLVIERGRPDTAEAKKTRLHEGPS